MSANTQSMLLAYFTTILPFCNAQKVLGLFASLGYQVKEVTPQLCLEAYNEYGKEFQIPFGKIAFVAQNSPKYEAYLKALRANSDLMKTKVNCNGDKTILKKLKLNKATSEKTPLTNDQKIQITNSVLSTFTGLLTSGVQITDTIINKESNKLVAEAQLLDAHTANAQAQTKDNTKTIIYCVGGAVLLIIVIAIIAVILKKK